MPKKDPLSQLAAALGGADSQDFDTPVPVALEPTVADSIAAAKKAIPTPAEKAAKFKLLDAVREKLNKQFKTTTSLVRLGDKVGIPMPSIGGGIYTFDYGVIGTGGLPRGRIIELFGPESGGKTTLALNYVAEEQARGGICAYVDAEHALDPTYMKELGVNVDELLVSQPDSGEQALETTEELVRSGAVTLVVIDSVAALVPQAELDGDMGDSHMGLQARMMSQAMRKLRGVCAVHGVTVVFINQIREKIGVMFGSPETTPGGRALKFFASVRVDVRRIGGDDGKIMSGDVLIGHRMRLRNVKNKVGSPARVTEIDLIYHQGIDKFADFVKYATEVGAIQKSGAWYSFNGSNIGQGLKNTVSALRDNAELTEKVRVEIDKAHAAQREAAK